MNREAKKQLTRARILEAAVELLECQGYEATTVQQIAARADVAKGTFFNYFTSKDELILELQSSMLRREIESKRGVPGQVLPQLLDSLLAHVRHFPLTPAVTRAVLQGVYGSERIGTVQLERSEAFIQFLTPIIEIGQARGEIRVDLTPARIAEMAVQSYYGVLMTWVLGQGRERLEELMRAHFEVLAEGLSA